MTIYNTGNPIGSTDTLDRADNTQNLDLLVVGPLDAYPDRLGVPRKSWRGMENDFSAFLAASGFELPALDYVDGSPLVVDRPTQLIDRDGVLYSVKATEPFPVTLSGSWASDQLVVVVRTDQDLRQDLASFIDPDKGSGLLGFNYSLEYQPQSIGHALKNGINSRAIEFFGPTDTPANTKATMQSAINFCAANNLLLISSSPEYTVDLSSSSITIPNNFRCDLGNAWIKRATGNTTPKDMWVNSDIVNGNSGLDIRNVRFDGQRQADSLTNATVAHRFCGLRLVKCSGYIENVRANNTVNGEIQAEGTRGAIMLDRSVDIKAFKLFADGTMGSGVFPYQGKNFISGVWAANNTGSGFTSYGCDDNEFHFLHSDVSGYSGVSINGERIVASNLHAKNSAAGFAGVGIGHPADGNRSTNSLISNVTVDGALGWGITIRGSANVRLTNWRVNGSTNFNMWVFNSPSLRAMQGNTRGALNNDIRIEGSGLHFLDGDFAGGAFGGILAFDGAVVDVSEQSLLASYGSGGGSTAAVFADVGSRIVFRGQALSNLRYGAIANGAGSVVDLVGAKLDNNTVGDTAVFSGGAIRHDRTRLSNDPMSGTLTIPSAGTSVVVSNGNAVDAGRIAIMPTDSVSAAAGIPRVTALVAGTSFTVAVSSAVPSNATYRYVLL